MIRLTKADDKYHVLKLGVLCPVINWEIYFYLPRLITIYS